MSIQRLLEEFIDSNKDVTFPVHHADGGHVTSASTYYGFSTDGISFQTHWSLRFSSPVRVTAAFTGVIYMRSDYPGRPVILLKIFSTPPLNRIHGLPDWYPLPKVAKYEPFTEGDFRRIIEDLFTVDLIRITELVGPDSTDIANRIQENTRRLTTVMEHYLSANSLPAGTIVPVTELIDHFLNGTLASGIPVSAGTVLLRSSGNVNFWLYPIGGHNAPDETLFFNPNFYFDKWRNRVENYSSFPAAFRSSPLGPPLSTGNILYIKQTAAPGFTPLYSNIYDALSTANENDTLLILDKAIYDSPKINKFISIMALLSSEDEADVKVHDSRSYDPDSPDYAGSSLSAALTRNYPTITDAVEGKRGILIQYRQGAPVRDGLIYLNNLAITGNNLNVGEERLWDNRGGAGIFVDGRFYRGEGDSLPIGKGFSQVHIHNCAIVHNRMVGWPRSVPEGDDDLPGIEYCGGGIFCYHSSPLISNCLIKGNSSFCHGGGIGIFKYGWPTIINNVISNNTALGHPYADFDGGREPGGNGDGGGIGVFQAYPSNKREWDEPGFWDFITGDLAERVIATWNPIELRDAKRKYIHIHGNIIHDNKAEMSGGGVYGTVLTLFSMHNNQIYTNRAVQQDGGGVCVTYGSELNLNGTSNTLNRIEGNVAGRHGGGVYIRSAKVELRNVSIQDNAFVTTAGSSGHGGGIAVLSKPEILDLLFPKYDIVLRAVFDNIDMVELILENAIITGNMADTGAGLYVFKDLIEYNLPPRSAGLQRGLIRPLSIHLYVETESDVHSNRPDNFYVYKIDPLPGTVSLTYSDPPSNTIIELTF